MVEARVGGGKSALWTVFIYPSRHVQTHTCDLPSPIMCTDRAALPGPETGSVPREHHGLEQLLPAGRAVFPLLMWTRW